MKPLYEDGALSPEAAKMVPAVAEVLRDNFGNDYRLDMPDGFDWCADEKRMHDAVSLLIHRQNPEEMLGLYQNSDAKKMNSVADALMALRLRIGELSEPARVHLSEHEKHRDQWLDIPTRIELLSLAVLRNRSEAALEAKRWIENSGWTVRSDKRWDAIAVAFECCAVWERQKGKPPFLDQKRFEHSPFGKFLAAVFEAVEIKITIKATFKQLRKLGLTKPSISPKFLQREKTVKN